MENCPLLQQVLLDHLQLELITLYKVLFVVLNILLIVVTSFEEVVAPSLTSFAVVKLECNVQDYFYGLFGP